MKEVFKNSRLTCIITEEGISLYGNPKEAYYPYGCMKNISMNLFGALVIHLGSYEATFLVEKEDRSRVRSLIKEAKEKIKTAQPEEYKIYSKCSKVSDQLPPEEQLKQYKNLFVTGTISKGYYDLKKRLLQNS